MSKPDSFAYPPRGMSRETAARYLGIGTTLFDEMVADRRMPRPKSINNRRVWDRVSLDLAFENLPEPDGREAFREALEASVVQANERPTEDWKFLIDGRGRPYKNEQYPGVSQYRKKPGGPLRWRFQKYGRTTLFPAELEPGTPAFDAFYQALVQRTAS